MEKKPKTLKLTDKTKATIDRLATDFKSIDDFIKSACEAYENNQNDFTQKVTNINNDIWDVSVEMERVRDHDPENFTPKMEKSYNQLNDIWDELRSNPYYYEINSSRRVGFED